VWIRLTVPQTTDSLALEHARNCVFSIASQRPLTVHEP
jgi:hypothetical protein